MTLHQKKVKKFRTALDSFERYKKWMDRLLDEGKISILEYADRLDKRAEMLDL